MPLWHYINTNGQQGGPVNADAVRQMLASNQLDLNSLVWREGLAVWVSLGEIAAELGIVSRVAHIRSASGKAIATRSIGKGATIAIVATSMFAALYLGFLVKVAVGGFNDYQARDRIVSAINEVFPLRGEVSKHYKKFGRCPDSASDGFFGPKSYASAAIESAEIGVDADGHCTILVRLKPIAALSSDAAIEFKYFAADDNYYAQAFAIEERHLPGFLRKR